MNYQGNSKLEKEVADEVRETPKLKKIEGIVVTEKKPSLGRRIKENFGGQDLKSVGRSLFEEVIIPSTRDLLMALINEGSSRAIYGEGSRRSSSTIPTTIVGSSRVRSTSYNTMSQSPLVGTRSAGDTSIGQRERNPFDFSGLVFATRTQAMETMEQMGEPVMEFGRVTVADFYDLIGKTGNGFTDQTNGWTAQGYNQFKVVKHRDGWVLDMPSPIGLA